MKKKLKITTSDMQSPNSAGEKNYNLKFQTFQVIKNSKSGDEPLTSTPISSSKCQNDNNYRNWRQRLNSILTTTTTSNSDKKPYFELQQKQLLPEHQHKINKETKLVFDSANKPNMKSFAPKLPRISVQNPILEPQRIHSLKAKHSHTIHEVDENIQKMSDSNKKTSHNRSTSVQSATEIQTKIKIAPITSESREKIHLNRLKPNESVNLHLTKTKTSTSQSNGDTSANTSADTTKTPQSKTSERITCAPLSVPFEIVPQHKPKHPEIIPIDDETINKTAKSRSSKESSLQIQELTSHTKSSSKESYLSQIKNFFTKIKTKDKGVQCDDDEKKRGMKRHKTQSNRKLTMKRNHKKRLSKVTRKQKPTKSIEKTIHKQSKHSINITDSNQKLFGIEIITETVHSKVSKFLSHFDEATTSFCENDDLVELTSDTDKNSSLNIVDIDSFDKLTQALILSRSLTAPNIPIPSLRPMALACENETTQSPIPPPPPPPTEPPATVEQINFIVPSIKNVAIPLPASSPSRFDKGLTKQKSSTALRDSLKCLGLKYYPSLAQLDANTLNMGFDNLIYSCLNQEAIRNSLRIRLNLPKQDEAFKSFTIQNDSIQPVRPMPQIPAKPQIIENYQDTCVEDYTQMPHTIEQINSVLNVIYDSPPQVMMQTKKKSFTNEINNKLNEYKIKSNSNTINTKAPSSSEKITTIMQKRSQNMDVKNTCRSKTSREILQEILKLSQ